MSKKQQKQWAVVDAKNGRLISVDKNMGKELRNFYNRSECFNVVQCLVTYTFDRKALQKLRSNLKVPVVKRKV